MLAEQCGGSEGPELAGGERDEGEGDAEVCEDGGTRGVDAFFGYGGEASEGELGGEGEEGEEVGGGEGGGVARVVQADVG